MKIVFLCSGHNEKHGMELFGGHAEGFLAGGVGELAPKRKSFNNDVLLLHAIAATSK